MLSEEDVDRWEEALTEKPVGVPQSLSSKRVAELRSLIMLASYLPKRVVNALLYQDRYRYVPFLWLASPYLWVAEGLRSLRTGKRRTALFMVYTLSEYCYRWLFVMRTKFGWRRRLASQKT